MIPNSFQDSLGRSSLTSFLTSAEALVTSSSLAFSSEESAKYFGERKIQVGNPIPRLGDLAHKLERYCLGWEERESILGAWFASRLTSGHTRFMLVL